MEALPVLLRAYPFQDVSARDIEPLLSSFVRHAYRRGETIWDVGDPANDLWFLLTGAIHGVHSTPDGEEIVTMLYGAGESFGEIGLFLPGATRHVRCVATEATVALTLSREPLMGFLSDHPPALRRMLEMLSTTVFRIGVSFREHALRDIPSRLAWRLLDLAERHGEPVSGGIRIRLRLTQTVLAGLLGASRENVNRALSAFSAMEAIRLEGGHIVILSSEKLRGVLGGDEGMLLPPPRAGPV